MKIDPVTQGLEFNWKQQKWLDSVVRAIEDTFWTTAESPSRVNLIINGEEIAYFRNPVDGAVFSIDSEGTEEGTYPVFEVNERYSRPKTLARSILIGDSIR